MQHATDLVIRRGECNRIGAAQKIEALGPNDVRIQLAGTAETDAHVACAGPGRATAASLRRHSQWT
jgi:hypothetical protein